MIGPEVVEVNVANLQTPMGEVDKVRNAREMKTIQGNWGAKIQEKWGRGHDARGSGR
jgi:hypothetical protein